MNEENYRLFGLDKTATDEQLETKYQELVKKYKEERWLEGEAGNEAAKMLTKIKTAYEEIQAERKEQTNERDTSDAYEEIALLLKNGNLTEAQTRLDSFESRGAEWHYLQAVVFYRKNWSNESKKQLEIAMQMDPSNVKYRDAYQKLNAKDNYRERSAQNNTERPYDSAPDSEQMGGNACSNCASCCYTYLCVDCLFSLCCGCR